MKVTKRILAGGLMLGVLGAFSSQAAAATITIASFQDPTVGAPGTPPPYLFTYQAVGPTNTIVGATLSGGYTSAGANPDLSLNVLGTTFAAAGFIFPTLTATAGVSIDGIEFIPAGPIGTITFLDSANNAVLFIDFDRAFLNTATVGGSDLNFTANVINIRPASGPDNIGDPETFAFSFANNTQTLAAAEANNSSVQATAAFTSSATLLVPEPGTLALLGLGLAGLGFGTSRRKKVAA